MLGVITLVGIVVVVITYNVPNQDVGLETFKALLQLVVVGVIGGLIASIVKEIEEERQNYDKQKELERQEREAIREFKKLILEQIVDAYSQTKRIRRLLRAKGLTLTNVPEEENFVRQKVYSEEMERLSIIQLNFETIGTKINTSFEVFIEAENLTALIRKMDTYLSDNLVNEYEESLRTFDAQLKQCSLAQLPKIRDFLTLDYEHSKFKTDFVKPYKTVLKTLQQEILAMRS
ncbi:MAG: hypothetical protein F6K41_38595 [Symploca sp. SIO3E6]|nr:hypothetical protein [Caldora sp. SIO3E6]